jgi:hypothetical protein
MNICVIPAFQRPEYLKECLSNIEKADGHEDLILVIALDYGYDAKNIQIVNESSLRDQCFISRTPRNGFKLGKQSFNVLKNLLQACSQNDIDVVYYVEDDIFISKDFFTFGEEVLQKEPDIFAFIGTESHNIRVETSHNKNAYYLTDKADFQTHGVCYNAKKFMQYIAPHITGNYFNNPIAYCNQFASVVCQKGYCEQDGLIRRVIEKEKLVIAYPHVARAQHAGIYGYNRNNGIMKLTYEKRLAFIQETCYDAEKMKVYDKYDDSRPCDMNLQHEKVELIPIN